MVRGRFLEIEPDSGDPATIADGIGSPEGNLTNRHLDVGTGSDEPLAVHADGDGLGHLERSQIAIPITASAVFVEGKERPSPRAEPHATATTKRVVGSLQSKTSRHLHPLGGSVREAGVALTPLLRCQRPSRPSKFALEWAVDVDVELRRNTFLAHRVERLNVPRGLLSLSSHDREGHDDRHENEFCQLHCLSPCP